MTLFHARRHSPGAPKWHAVPRSRDTALCGRRPPAGESWTDPGETVTCPRCQRLAETLARVAAVPAYDPRSQFDEYRQLCGEARRLVVLRRLGLVQQVEVGQPWTLIGKEPTS